MSKAMLLKFLLIAVAFYFGMEIATIFQDIKLRSNPAIYLPSGDTISNRTAGTIVFGGTVKAAGFISDTNLIAGNNWQVSPSFTLNTYRKTSPTVQGAIDNIDSGIIYINPGVYNERVTIKSRISLIGYGYERVLFTRTEDSCIIYGTGISKFYMSGISLKCFIETTDTASLVRIRNSYLDSTNTPSIVFENIFGVITNTGVSDKRCFGLKSDSSMMTIKNSYIRVIDVTGVGIKATIKAGKSSIIYSFNNILVSNEGNPSDAIIYMDDARCKIIIGFCQVNLTAGSIFNPGETIYGRIYNTISPESFSGVTNLIATPNNIVDANYYIK